MSNLFFFSFLDSEVCSDDYAKIIVDPESVEVLEGDAAQFNCAIIANDGKLSPLSFLYNVTRIHQPIHY